MVSCICQLREKGIAMFTAIVINPAATYTATFASFEAAEEWAFCPSRFVRGVSRVEIRDPKREVVAWY